MSALGMTYREVCPQPVAFIVYRYTAIPDETHGVHSIEYARSSVAEDDAKVKAFGPHMDDYRIFGFWRVKEAKPDLPDGLLLIDGIAQYQCNSCELWTQWEGEAGEFELGAYENLCGGSERCVP